MTIALRPASLSKRGIDVIRVLAGALAGAMTLPANASAASLGWVYPFTNGTDGANPIAGLAFDGSSTLYGATFFGGANGQGTLFSISTSGGTPTTLHAFNTSTSPGEGAGPGGTPTIDATSGNILGTTVFASINSSNVGSGNGTVYSYSLSGGTLNVVHTFSGGSTDGANPYAGLLSSTCSAPTTPPTAPNYYGTTTAGGSSNYGTLFKITPTGSGGYTYVTPILYSVSGFSGQNAYGPLACDTYSTLYGTTVLGGSSSQGLAFSITTSGGSPTAITSLGYTSVVGAQPRSGLYVVDSSHLVGTTTLRGANGKGAVYLLTYSGGSAYTYSAIYSFGATSSDGNTPWGTLIADTYAKNGTLYGTTLVGGASGQGTVFKLTRNSPTGYTYTYTQIYSFSGASDGSNPNAALTMDPATGYLYGTTKNGGTNGYGTIFQIMP